MQSDNTKRRNANTMEHGIWYFYKYGIGIAAIILMLTHWYGVYDYSCMPRPVVIDTEQNGHCIIWIYCLAYVYMPMMMIPASKFFRQCWLWRVPYVYFFGINAIRIAYGHWLIRYEMIDAHEAMIIMTIIVYIYGLAPKVAGIAMSILRRGRRQYNEVR